MAAREGQLEDLVKLSISQPLKTTTQLAVIALASMLHPSLEAQDIRTPPAPPSPQIHGPKIYGARPGHPFLYRIPSTGTRPIVFKVRSLPRGLHLDAKTGIVTGTTPRAGTYRMILEATNAAGRTERPFTLVAGDKLGLTPQMGWNDWYSYYEHITDADVRSAADALVRSGMADYGYQFIDIDDAWARRPKGNDPAISGNTRDADGNIRPNDRFPDMAALTAYVHSLGLKAGIYTSPGPTTCAGFEGSWAHEAQDAKEFARWGFDLLKYDYCSYTSVANDHTQQRFKTPYFLMGGILRQLDRDLIYNLCEYGNADVWEWAESAGGNSWRTTDDVGVAKGSLLPGFYSVAFSNAAHAGFARPGAWNDPDYILIGTVGDARHITAPAKRTSLTSEEQYSYMSLWSMMASPLFFAGQMTNLDAFTLNILCNPEVIDIDQDTRGEQARVVRHTDQEFVLSKQLDDGSRAVGLFNLSEAPREISVSFSDLGLTGPQAVRDVWRERDLGLSRETYSVTVPAHGVMLVRMQRSASRR